MTDFRWKKLEATTLVDPDFVKMCGQKFEEVEAAMLRNLTEELFPPLTLEEIAEAERWEKENRRLHRRIKRWLQVWRWRFSGAWDCLRGYDDRGIEW